MPTAKRSSEHTLWFPEPAEIVRQTPTWLRRIGKSDDGDVITLGMVLEEEPTGRHAERIAEHREGLDLLNKVSEAVLRSHPPGDPERGGMGFTLAFFAGELASVLGPGELGAASVDAALRQACLESIALSTRNTSGLLVGGKWIRPAGRKY